MDILRLFISKSIVVGFIGSVMGVLIGLVAFQLMDSSTTGDDVAVVFAGAGTRWPEELAKLDNPAHGLYESVRESVQGASCGCADAFGATESLEACNVPLIKDHALAGTSGVASPRRFVEQGYETLVF